MNLAHNQAGISRLSQYINPTPPLPTRYTTKAGKQATTGRQQCGCERGVTARRTSKQGSKVWKHRAIHARLPGTPDSRPNHLADYLVWRFLLRLTWIGLWSSCCLHDDLDTITHCNCTGLRLCHKLLDLQQQQQQ